MRSGIWTLFLGWALGACAPPQDTAHRTGSPVMVAAAASLRDLCEKARPGLERALEGRELVFSYDASSTLARQIQAGALFDVFLSADRENTERVRAFWADPEPRRILQGELVLAAVDQAELGELSELVEKEGTIAIAGGEVPAGRYARRLLEDHGLLAGLEGRFVLASNVRATLALVESGSATWGFVYRTDLMRSERTASGVEPGRAQSAWEAGPDAIDSVAWFGVSLTTGRAPEAAAAFLETWRTSMVLGPAKALGFRPPSEAP